MGCEGAIEGLSYGGGNIFVGAAVPFGVAKVGIDTYETNRTFAAINGGYTSNGMVTGVSRFAWLPAPSRFPFDTAFNPWGLSGVQHSSHQRHVSARCGLT